MKLDFDVVIIGAGPAGMAAAIYLNRAGAKPLMIDNNAPGGQLNRISVIENYPGFTKISGPDLAYNIFTQTQELGVPYKYGNIINIIDKKKYKIIKTDNEEITCKAVIIASGRKPKELGLENEKKLLGKGISYCALCDGILFKDKDVVIAGNSSDALTDSLYLSKIANKITIINKYDDYNEQKEVLKEVNNNQKITILYNTNIIKLNEIEGHLNGVDIKDKDGIKTLSSSGLFVHEGFEPSLSFADNLKIKKTNGYIKVDEDMKTSINGIYACGDIVYRHFYQITTAVADGCKAAIAASYFLTK